jgi:hypothetical protein
MHFDKKAQIRNSRRVKHTITAQGQHVQTTLGACLTVPYSALQCLTVLTVLTVLIGWHAGSGLSKSIAMKCGNHHGP